MNKVNPKAFPLDHFQDDTIFPEEWQYSKDKELYEERMAKRGFNFQNDWTKWRKKHDH